jgi:amidophosphoribosyltransferase
MSGIVGVVSNSDCKETLFYATDYHSHLGTQFAGLAVWGSALVKRIHDIQWAQFKSKFYNEMLLLSGDKGIGVISAKDPQPIVINSRHGHFAICTNGFIENAQSLAKELLDEGESFSDSYDSQINTAELVAKLINKKESIPDGIGYMFSRISGSCSLLILTKDGIWAARDRFGYTPLVLGSRNGELAIVSESSAFLNLGFNVQKVLAPGEIVFVSNSGVKEVRAPGGSNQICAFLWIYTGFPASSYEGINVEVVRERCGRFLARNDDVRADLAAGIPDSGTTHAIGYAMESGIPFRRPLVKYTPGFDRSYTPPVQQTRDLIAKMKLLAIREIIDGKRIVLCDDSIVRGTQLKNFTIQKVWKCGAKEVHLRIACPPLMFPCRFNFSTRAASELATRRAIRALEGLELEDVSAYLDEGNQKYAKMVNWIARELGVTSLKYQKLEDMIAAIGLPTESICLYCWTGKCP